MGLLIDLYIYFINIFISLKLIFYISQFIGCQLDSES